MMDRRTFLNCVAAALATGYAADQLELLDRIKTPVKYFFGKRVERMHVLPLEAHFRDPVSGLHYSRWMKPDVPVTMERACILERVTYHGPLPRDLTDYGITKVNLPLSYGVTPVCGGNNLTIALPEPLGWFDDGTGYHLIRSADWSEYAEA